MKLRTKILWLALLALACALDATAALKTNLISTTTGTAPTLPVAMSRINTNMFDLDWRGEDTRDAKFYGNLTAFTLWQKYSNGPVTIVNFGDSLASLGQSCGDELITKLQANYGLAGYAGFNYVGNENWPVSSSANIGTQNGILPLWPWDLLMLTNSSAFAWWTNPATPNGITVTSAELFWIAHPGGGPFDLNLRQNGSASFTTVKGLNGYNATPVGRWTNVTFAAAPTVMMVSNTASGTNFIAGNRLQNSGVKGVTGFWFGSPGRAYSDYTNVSRAVWDPIWTNVAPTLVLVHGKEGADVSGISEVDARLDLMSKSKRDIVYVGSYEWDDTGSSVEEQRFYRTNALRNLRTYVPMRYRFPAHSNMVAQGLVIADNNPHPTAAGIKAVGTALIQELGMDWLLSDAADVTGKADKAGGNSFTGPNNFSEINATNFNVWGANAAVGLRYRDDQANLISLIANGNGFSVADSKASYAELFRVWNVAGTPEIDVAPGFARPRLFANYRGDGFFRDLDTTNLTVRGSIIGDVTNPGQHFFYYVHATNFIAWGSGASVGLRYRDDQSQQLALFANGNGFSIADSKASYADLFRVWNSSGTPEIDVAPGFAPPRLFPNYRGEAYLRTLYATNFNLNLPTGVTPGNTTTPAAWGQVTNNGSRYFVPMYQ